MTERPLPSWRDGPTRTAVVDFVRHTSGEDGSTPVPVEERVAVFDNDGTLWCEKPMPFQLDFSLRQLAADLAERPELRERQPWKAVADHDVAWFGGLLTEHYAGDDTNVRALVAGILTTYAGISVEEFERRADAFLRSARHPTLGRGYLQCVYAPMVELLGYLEANGFSNYIVSGGGRDFMRPISWEIYGVPRERVIGSSSALAYVGDDHGGTIVHTSEADYLDDGPEKPVRIWNRTGRRPLLAAGNSNGDTAMLEYTTHADKPTHGLVILHDDVDREFDYTDGAERVLARAPLSGWTVVSMRDDWVTIF
jgi:phosphoserine phosphatase